MILERLKVLNWRNLRKTVELKGFSKGINIIHAPNGVGKSSLFEALRRGIFDAHHITGEKIKAVQPWGCSLSAEVEVDFVHNGIHYRIEKRFLKRKFARLLQKEKGVFQPLVDGRQADEKVREILKASNGIGAAKPQHWGLYQALWAPQGKLELGSLSQDLTANLQDALSNQLIGEKGNLLEKLLKEHYLEFFTPTGKVKTGKKAPPINALEKDLEQLQIEYQELEERQREFEETSHLVKSLENQTQQVRNEVGKLRKKVERIRRGSEKYDQLAGELKQHQSDEKAAHNQHKNLSEKIERIQSTRENIKELEDEIVATNRLIQQLTQELKTARQKETEAQKKYNHAKRRRKELDQLNERKDAARDFLDAQKSSGELKKRLEKLSNEQTDLAELKKQQANLAAPNAQQIRAIRDAIASKGKAEVALQASLIHLTIEPFQDARVRNKNKNDLQSISGGESETFSGSPEVAVEVEGFGSIRAAGPEGDAEKHRQTLAKSEKQINELTRSYGTKDPDQLQNLLEKAKELNSQIKNTEESIEELLDGQTLNELRQQYETIKALMDKCLEKYPEWREKLPVPSEMQAEYKTRQRQIEDAVNSIEEELTTEQENKQTVENRLTEAKTDLRNHSENLKAAKKQLKTDLQDQTLEQLEEKKHEFLMTWKAARVEVADCKKRLSGLSKEVVNSLEKQLAEKEVSEKEKSAQENLAKGRLQTLANEGVYSRRANCKERLAETKEEVRREQLQMDALSLLHDTVSESKGEILADVSGPVEEKATEMWKRIAGVRLGQVCFSEDFQLSGVQPQALEENVAYGNLSGGEREQLFLIVRLALAQVLAGKERQLVVLDDVLHASDGKRIKRLCQLLEKEAEKKLQIVLLTCHPERYADWKGKGVLFFDLLERIGELQ